MQIQYKWDKRHSKILHEYLSILKDRQIEYFILRNYEGLPEKNESKDVDIIINPNKYRSAAELFIKVLKENNVPNYYVVQFERAHCWIGLDLSSDFYIHVDLIAGYLNKGFEIFDFHELYKNTIEYHGYTVLSPSYDIVMLLLYNVIGCRELKKKYRDKISERFLQNRLHILKILEKVFDKNMADIICAHLDQSDFEWIIQNARCLSKHSKVNAFKKRPIYTTRNVISFFKEKVYRIAVCPRKIRKMIAVEAPDGTGKTTFIDLLAVKLAECFVTDISKVHIYHFRPTLIPNLGELGERAGIMEQDKEFTKPHRGKKTNTVSSLIRIIYYTVDYILGGFVNIRKDVQFDKFTVFDRYAYDFLVDPKRSKINLPFQIRRFFCRIVPQPQITFVLNADPTVVFSRKQELTLNEIKRQMIEFNKLKDIAKGYVKLDANKTPEEITDQALSVIIDYYTNKTNDYIA